MKEMYEQVMQHGLVKYPASAAATAVAVSETPIVGSMVAMPLASMMTRQAVVYTLTTPGQTYFQTVAISSLAEMTATQAVLNGYTPVILASGAATVTFVGVAAYYAGKLAYECSLPVVSEASQTAQSYSISRIDLEAIVASYQTRSILRQGFRFFMGSDSLEIAAIKKYLNDNPNLENIELSALAKAIEAGKKYRVNALEGHQSIVGNMFHNGGTDAIINEIVNRSTLTAIKTVVSVVAP